MNSFIIFFVVATILSSTVFGELEANRETEIRADRVKRATCLQWKGGDACRKKCQGMVSSCTGKRYTTGHCEMSWTVATCVCKPYCDV